METVQMCSALQSKQWHIRMQMKKEWKISKSCDSAHVSPAVDIVSMS